MEVGDAGHLAGGCVTYDGCDWRFRDWVTGKKSCTWMRGHAF